MEHLDPILPPHTCVVAEALLTWQMGTKMATKKFLHLKQNDPPHQLLRRQLETSSKEKRTKIHDVITANCTVVDNNVYKRNR